jgi:hypothetical protein
MTDDGRLSTQIEYDNILKQQVTISYLCNGISISDTDEMTPYDRKIIYDHLCDIKNKEMESFKKAKQG